MRKMMDARGLSNAMNYYSMERKARSILISDKIATAEEVALMTCVDVCDKLLDYYMVVACEDETITLVRKEDIEKYNGVVKLLTR